MMELILQRVGQSPRGTFGVLKHGEVPFVLTLERPWEDNEVGKSCIPTGLYVCQRVRSPKFGNTFEVTNVPGRSTVLFHSGNTIEETQGCILIGEEFSGTWEKPMIVASRRGFLEFLDLLKGVGEFRLLVIGSPAVLDA